MNIVQAIAEMQHGLELNADQQFGYTVARAQATAIAKRSAQREEALLSALKTLLYEVDCAGLGDAHDFWWPEATKKARQAIAQSEAA